jgi:mono/diheme cytochrome c family protein
MNRWCVAVITSGAFALISLTIATAYVARGGISSRAEPSRLEASIARALRGWMIPSSARELANPIPASARVLAEGRAHFADHCATCHANDGSGQTRIGRGLYPRAPDMREEATQRLTDGELFYIIENGVRFTGMPAWGGSGNPEASWHLVHFIRHLPKLTDEEEAQMEAMNPKSAAEWREMEEDEAFLKGEPTPADTRRRDSHSH